MPFMLVWSAAHSSQPESTPELEPSASLTVQNSKEHALTEGIYKLLYIQLLYIIIVLIFIVLIFQCTFFTIIISIV